MISHRCFNGYWPADIESNLAWYLFSDEGISFLPLKFFLENSPSTFNFLDIQRIVECDFPFHDETVSASTDFIFKSFSFDENNRLTPTEEAIGVYQKTKRALGFLKRALDLDEAQRMNEMADLLKCEVPDLCHVLGSFMADLISSNLVPEDAAGCILYAYFFSSEAEAAAITEKLLALGSADETNQLSSLSSPRIENVVKENGIFSLNDLSFCAPERIQALFPLNCSEFCACIAKLLPCALATVADGCNELLYDLSKKEEEVLKLRYWLHGKTLEETSIHYEVTRQRIQQIEAKAFRKLRAPIRYRVYAHELLPQFYEWYLENKDDYGLLPASKIVDELKAEDKLAALFVIFVGDKHLSSFEYNSKIGVLFESKTNIEGAFKTMSERMPDAIPEDDFNLLDDYVKKGLLLYKRYKLNDNGVYTKTGRKKRNEYLDIIEEAFPTGYKLYGEDDYIKFIEAWKKKHGEQAKIPSRPALRGAIGENWQLVADGVYLPRHKCPKLPEEMLPAIYEYIESLLPAVYYRSIFFEFEDRLRDVGIDNPAMFKGAFDLLDNKFKHARDYLKSKNWAGTCYDAIVARVKTIEGIFTADKLREYFPYVENYVFYFCLDKQPGVVHLFNEYYLFVDENTFSEKDLDDLANAIERYLSLSGLDSISGSKLYEKLKYVDETQLLQRLEYAFNENALLAIIGNCLSDRYDTTSNYVGRKGKTVENRWDAFSTFIQTADEFDKSDIDSVAAKYGFASNYTFADIISLASSTHVQVDKDSLVRKELLQLDDSTIDAISNALSMLIKAFGELNTKTFNRYFLLPKIGQRTWNKYLLAGIARSYFGKEYKVTNTDGDYRITDFIIRRKNG